MRQITAYVIVDKKNPKIKVAEIYTNKKDAVLLKSEKWVTVIIKEK